MEEKKPAAAPEEPPKVTEKEVRNALDEMDTYDYETLLRNIQTDVINNEDERKFFEDPANNRLTEIDFIEGLSTGSFSQWVTIVPEKFKVLFRTLAPDEQQSIRLWIYKLTQDDPDKDKLASEIYSLALVVACVVQINGNKLPEHMEPGPNHSRVLNTETFQQKYNQFIRYANPMVHALGVHSQWFDRRVRRMFTKDYAKNG